MTTTRPTPEAIAADIHATARAYSAGVITEPERKWRLDVAWLTASRLGLTDATIRALATIDEASRPFGPGTLDVLLNAESHSASDRMDAIEALTGGVGVVLWRDTDRIEMDGRALAALVRALRGGSHGA